MHAGTPHVRIFLPYSPYAYGESPYAYGDQFVTCQQTFLKSRVEPASRHQWDLVATALVLAAEAAAALIADDTNGGNSGVTIIVRASLAAGGGLIINSIVYLLSTL